jgi:hypothetical protein
MSRRLRQLCWGTAISAISAASLNACGTHVGSPAQAPPSQATTTTAAAAPPPVPGPRSEKWIDLDVGNCLADVPQVDLGEVDVTVVDCAEVHKAEVYFRGPLTVNAAIPDVANSKCATELPKYTGQGDSTRYSVTYLVDSNQDRTTIAPTVGPAPSTVICLLEDPTGQPLTGSARR